MAVNTSIPGWMTFRELDVIELLAAQVPENGLVVEVGCFLGRSAWAWSQSIPQSARLVCIDPWYMGYENYGKVYFEELEPKFPRLHGEGSFDSLQEFKANMKDCSNLEIIQAISPQGIKWDGRKIDALFLDGDHSLQSMLENFEFWLPHMQNTGIICGHDYRGPFRGVVESVNQVASRLKKEVKVFERTSIWQIL